MRKQAESNIFVGLDLGKISDYTAVVVVERQPAGPADGHARAEWRYDVRHLQRFALSTSYPQIVSAVEDLVRRRELRYWITAGGQKTHIVKPPNLIVDGTGIGSAIVDMFLSDAIEANVIPLTITSGSSAHEGRWGDSGVDGFWVGKQDIVAVTQKLLQCGRLRVAPALPLAETLKRELMDFEVKISPSANEIFSARSGRNDDLTLALACALWVAERPPNVPWVGPSPLANYRGMVAGWTPGRGAR